VPAHRKAAFFSLKARSPSVRRNYQYHSRRAFIRPLCGRILFDGAKRRRFVGGLIPPLDGHHFKNVIFENIQITYDGGPLILENVAFINCSFHLGQNEEVALFASNVLKSKEVVFTAG
jgi:hypothetical protein